MTIRLKCNQCNKVFEVREDVAGKKGKCSCGAILTVPSNEPISDKTVSSTESQTSTISESFLAISIGLVALILAFSFACGAILTKPDTDKIVAQVEKIEQDICHAKNESEQLKKQILDHRSNTVKTPIVTKPQIVCDKFELVTKVSGSKLNLSVDTDLPDNAVVMVSVSRSYLEKGNSETYSVDYFSEKSTIGKWVSEHSISIFNEVWKTALRAEQEKMSRLGLGFDVASISDKITARMVVPINQPDPNFGDENQNLTGKAVRTKVVRFVEDEIEIDYPLNAPPVGKSLFPSLFPLELEIGQAYVVSKQTPLMPSHSPADPVAAIQKVKQIPKGGGFKVLEVYKEKIYPWYKVTAFDQSTEEIGIGWINSTALLGQQLKVHK